MPLPPANLENESLFNISSDQNFQNLLSTTMPLLANRKDVKPALPDVNFNLYQFYHFIADEFNKLTCCPKVSLVGNTADEALGGPKSFDWKIRVTAKYEEIEKLIYQNAMKDSILNYLKSELKNYELEVPRETLEAAYRLESEVINNELRCHVGFRITIDFVSDRSESCSSMTNGWEVSISTLSNKFNGSVKFLGKKEGMTIEDLTVGPLQALRERSFQSTDSNILSSLIPALSNGLTMDLMHWEAAQKQLEQISIEDLNRLWLKLQHCYSNKASIWVDFFNLLLLARESELSVRKISLMWMNTQEILEIEGGEEFIQTLHENPSMASAFHNYLIIGFLYSWTRPLQTTLEAWNLRYCSPKTRNYAVFNLFNEFEPRHLAMQEPWITSIYSPKEIINQSCLKYERMKNTDLNIFRPIFAALGLAASNPVSSVIFIQKIYDEWKGNRLCIFHKCYIQNDFNAPKDISDWIKENNEKGVSGALKCKVKPLQKPVILTHISDREEEKKFPAHKLICQFQKPIPYNDFAQSLGFAPWVKVKDPKKPEKTTGPSAPSTQSESKPKIAYATVVQAPSLIPSKPVVVTVKPQSIASTSSSTSIRPKATDHSASSLESGWESVKNRKKPFNKITTTPSTSIAQSKITATPSTSVQSQSRTTTTATSTVKIQSKSTNTPASSAISPSKTESSTKINLQSSSSKKEKVTDKISIHIQPQITQNNQKIDGCGKHQKITALKVDQSKSPVLNHSSESTPPSSPSSLKSDHSIAPIKLGILEEDETLAQRAESSILSETNGKIPNTSAEELAGIIDKVRPAIQDGKNKEKMKKAPKHDRTDKAEKSSEIKTEHPVQNQKKAHLIRIENWLQKARAEEYIDDEDHWKKIASDMMKGWNDIQNDLGNFPQQKEEVYNQFISILVRSSNLDHLNTAITIANNNYESINVKTRNELMKAFARLLPKTTFRQWPKKLMDNVTVFLKKLSSEPIKDNENKSSLVDCLNTFADSNLHQLISILVDPDSKAFDSLSYDQKLVIEHCIHSAIKTWDDDHVDHAINYARYHKKILTSKNGHHLLSFVQKRLFEMAGKPREAIETAIKWLPLYDLLQNRDSKELNDLIDGLSNIIATEHQITCKNELTHQLLELFNIAAIKYKVVLSDCKNGGYVSYLIIKFFTCSSDTKTSELNELFTKMREHLNYDNQKEFDNVRIAHMHYMAQSLRTGEFEQYIKNNWDPFIQGCLENGQRMHAFHATSLAGLFLIYSPHICDTLSKVCSTEKINSSDLMLLQKKLETSCFTHIGMDIKENFVLLDIIIRQEIFKLTLDLVKSSASKFIKNGYSAKAMAIHVPQFKKIIDLQYEWMKGLSEKTLQGVDVVDFEVIEKLHHQYLVRHVSSLNALPQFPGDSIKFMMEISTWLTRSTKFFLVQKVKSKKEEADKKT